MYVNIPSWFWKVQEAQERLVLTLQRSGGSLLQRSEAGNRRMDHDPGLTERTLA